MQMGQKQCYDEIMHEDQTSERHVNTATFVTMNLAQIWLKNGSKQMFKTKSSLLQNVYVKVRDIAFGTVE